MMPIVENKKIANLVDEIQKQYKAINDLNIVKDEVKREKQTSIYKNLDNNLEKHQELENKIDNLDEKLNNLVLDSFDFSESEKDLLNYTKDITIPLINNLKEPFNEI
jgi:hypothetical protein